MSEQNYKNHRYQPRSFLLATVLWLTAVIATLGAFRWGWNSQGFAAAALLAAVAVLIGNTREYATKLQDRIILLEMKIRCAEVLPAGHDAKLAKLSTRQIVGLRFAPDAELGDLLDRAVRENLSQKDIKLAVRQWKADRQRT